MEVLRKGSAVKEQLRQMLREREDWKAHVKRVVREAQVEVLGVAPAQVTTFLGPTDFQVEYGFKITEAQKQKIEQALTEARAALEDEFKAVQEAESWLALLLDDDLVEMELEDLKRFAGKR